MSEVIDRPITAWSKTWLHDPCTIKRDGTSEHYHDLKKCTDQVSNKRSLILCSKCCSSDLCNINSMCGSKDVPRAKGQKLCYGCSYGRPTSATCNTLKVCARNEMCRMRRQYSAFGETRWVTGCIQRDQCNEFPRSTQNCLDYCCESDLCNKNCSSFQKSMISSTPHQITSHHVFTPKQYSSTYSTHKSTTPGYGNINGRSSGESSTTSTKTTSRTVSSTSTTRKPNFQRTIIFINELTVSGQDMFIQGGLDKRHRQGCIIPVASRDACAIPIKSHSLGNSSHLKPYNAWRRGDNFLDWNRYEPHQGVYNGKRAQGTPAVWTTNRKKDSRYNEQNIYGDHYWLVDIDVDCDRTMNGWFEVHAVLNYQHERVIPSSQIVCNNMKVPYESIFHWAKCGMKNIFHFNQQECSIVPIS